MFLYKYCSAKEGELLQGIFFFLNKYCSVHFGHVWFILSIGLLTQTHAYMVLSLRFIDLLFVLFLS